MFKGTMSPISCENFGYKWHLHIRRKIPSKSSLQVKAGLTESHDATYINNKNKRVSSRSQTANTTVLNGQQQQLLGKLVTGIRVDEILVLTARKQQVSTWDICDPSCRLLTQSTLDCMDIILCLRTADLVMLQHFFNQKYE